MSHFFHYAENYWLQDYNYKGEDTKGIFFGEPSLFNPKFSGDYILEDYATSKSFLDFPKGDEVWITFHLKMQYN